MSEKLTQGGSGSRHSFLPSANRLFPRPWPAASGITTWSSRCVVKLLLSNYSEPKDAYFPWAFVKFRFERPDCDCLASVQQAR